MERTMHLRQRTKIVCTLGPASSSADMVERLIKADMNVVKLNLSFGIIYGGRSNLLDIK